MKRQINNVITMNKYKVWNGTSMIIKARTSEEAIEKFNGIVNECRCDDVSVEKLIEEKQQ